jgi:hypothetical protein
VIINYIGKVNKMVIFGDKNKPVFEVEMDRLNILTGKYERCWDYVHAMDSQEARTNIYWIHGQSIEILSINLHT